jgi:hypothetical protein
MVLPAHLPSHKQTQSGKAVADGDLSITNRAAFPKSVPDRVSPKLPAGDEKRGTIALNECLLSG